MSLVHALSVKFLALRLCSIFLLVKGTIISITSSEKSKKNASKSVFALSSQPTGTGIFITIFTDVRRRNFLINGIFVSYVVLHLLCLFLERPSTCSRSLSSHNQFQHYRATNQSTFFLNIFREKKLS